MNKNQKETSETVPLNSPCDYLEQLFNLKSKVAMITGASSGIGASLAEMYARQGCNVILLARSYDKIKLMSEKISFNYGVDTMAIKCDVCNEAEIKDAVDEAIVRFSKIDILINNAGCSEKSEDITAHTREQWDKVISTNLSGMFFVSKEVAKHMKSSNYGKIVNISSICGIMGLSNQVSYSASKAGVIGLTRSMAVELGKFGITVNAVAPGYLLTGLTDESSGGCRYFKSRTVCGFIGRPEDLYGTVLLLSSDASRYITGSVITVDGGITANV